MGAGTYTHLTVGDVNGDGRSDVLTRLDGKWYVSLSTGTGFAGKAEWGTWSSVAIWVDIRLADLDGDGKADLLGRTGLNWWVAADRFGIRKSRALDAVDEQPRLGHDSRYRRQR